MAKNDMAAHAAGNGQSNDSRRIDDLTSMFIRNARGRMMDDDIRLKVLARASVSCSADSDYKRAVLRGGPAYPGHVIR